MSARPSVAVAMCVFHIYIVFRWDSCALVVKSGVYFVSFLDGSVMQHAYVHFFTDVPHTPFILSFNFVPRTRYNFVKPRNGTTKLFIFILS